MGVTLDGSRFRSANQGTKGNLKVNTELLASSDSCPVAVDPGQLLKRLPIVEEMLVTANSLIDGIQFYQSAQVAGQQADHIYTSYTISR